MSVEAKGLGVREKVGNIDLLSESPPALFVPKKELVAGEGVTASGCLVEEKGLGAVAMAAENGFVSATIAGVEAKGFGKEFKFVSAFAVAAENGFVSAFAVAEEAKGFGKVELGASDGLANEKTAGVVFEAVEGKEKGAVLVDLSASCFTISVGAKENVIAASSVFEVPKEKSLGVDFETSLLGIGRNETAAELVVFSSDLESF